MVRKTAYKCIVAVDYGTTYTGISYATTNDTDIDKIQIISDWPGTSESVFKVPTKIAYKTENSSLDEVKWGYLVKGGMKSYTWTKLLLDRDIRLTDFDDSTLEDLFGSGLMRLPPNKSAQDVVKDFLSKVCEFVMEELNRNFQKEVFDTMAVECWLTVPAIWSDAARAATRTAAIDAGFASRSGDKVNIITEPEAAALAALKPHVLANALDPVKPGEGIMICDCGGGTVDITTYTIQSCQPKLVFKELCVGIGGKCGSTAIDRRFNQWLIDTFGGAYKKIPPKFRGPSSLFMRSFEEMKRSFGSTTADRMGWHRSIEIENLSMELPPGKPSKFYDEDQSTLTITSAEMKLFFDPVIDQIMKLLRSQIDSAKKVDHNIDRIILVGGFGNSAYLNKKLQEWCIREYTGVRLTCPPQCQSAVARGAVIRGLEGITPSSRKARRHYGYKIGMPFREGIDPEWRSYHEEWSATKYCNGRMEWVVHKGQEINTNFSVTHAIFQCVHEETDVTAYTELYCCSDDIAPQYSNVSSVQHIGTIRCDIPEQELKHLPRRKINRDWVKKLNEDIVVNMAAEQGTLTVKSLVRGKEVGRATIEFHRR